MSERKAKYTAGGKWRVDVRNNGKILGPISLNSPTICTMEVQTIGEGISKTHRTPDSVLIAAAPELFELGRAAMEDTCGEFECDDCPSLERCNMNKFIELLQRLESEVME